MAVASRLFLQYMVDHALYAALRLVNIMIKNLLIDDPLREDALIQAGARTYVLADVLQSEWGRRVHGLRIEDWTEDFREVSVHSGIMLHRIALELIQVKLLLRKYALRLLIGKSGNHARGADQVVIAQREVVRLYDHAPTLVCLRWEEKVRNILGPLVVVGQLLRYQFGQAATGPAWWRVQLNEAIEAVHSLYLLPDAFRDVVQKLVDILVMLDYLRVQPIAHAKHVFATKHLLRVEPAR